MYGFFRFIKRLLITAAVVAFLVMGFKYQKEIDQFLNPSAEKGSITKVPDWMKDKPVPADPREAEVKKAEREAYDAYVKMNNELGAALSRAHLNIHAVREGEKAPPPFMGGIREKTSFGSMPHNMISQGRYPSGLKSETVEELRGIEERLEPLRLNWIAAKDKLQEYYGGRQAEKARGR